LDECRFERRISADGSLNLLRIDGHL
jgi:hypothetical protein